MKCQEVQRLLNPFVDGELDFIWQNEIEQHLAECNECRERVSRLQSVREALRTPSLYYQVPASLAATISVVPAATTRMRLRQWDRISVISVAAMFIVGIFTTIGFLLSHMGTSDDERLSQLVIASHVRSLQVEHLTDVASTDCHTVKPWFHGKVDFAPQVPDLSDEGFILSGGRLDYLTDQSVAALVYYRRKHAINVITWPAINVDEMASSKLTRQGYHIRWWQQSGMTYWAISDLNDSELDEFVRLFRDLSKQSIP